MVEEVERIRMADETVGMVTVRLTTEDWTTLMGCLQKLAGWAQTRADQAAERLEQNSHDEGYQDRPRGVQIELKEATVLAHDAHRLSELLFRRVEPSRAGDSPAARRHLGGGALASA
jgi:hypothetical protein